MNTLVAQEQEKELEILHEEDRLLELEQNEIEVGHEAALLEGQIRSMKDEKFLKSINKAAYAQKKVPQKVRSSQIHDVLASAKQAVDAGNIREANSLIKEAQKLQKTMKGDDAEKRRALYSVMELETDMKIASL